MRIEERVVDGVMILDVKGEIHVGRSEASLRDTITSAVQRGHRRLLLDFKDVTYIDGAGLGVLIGTFVACRGQGGTIKLLHLTSRIHRLMSLFKLLTLFDTFDSEQEAVRSFSATHGPP